MNIYVSILSGCAWHAECWICSAWTHPQVQKYKLMTFSFPPCLDLTLDSGDAHFSPVLCLLELLLSKERIPSLQSTYLIKSHMLCSFPLWMWLEQIERNTLCTICNTLYHHTHTRQNADWHYNHFHYTVLKQRSFFIILCSFCFSFLSVQRVSLNWSFAQHKFNSKYFPIDVISC